MDLRPSAVFALLPAFPCLALLAALSPVLIQAQTPQVDITFNGKAVTGQKVPVLIGQPVNLGFTVSGGSVTTFRWLLPWGVVKYSPSPQSDQVTTLAQCAGCSTQPNPTIYWIDQYAPKTVTLGFVVNYVLNGQAKASSGNVSATFITQGPKNVEVTAYYNVNTLTKQGSPKGKVDFYNAADGKSGIGLGDGTAKNEGITFTITKADLPSGVNGGFEWVQIVNSDVIQYLRPNGTQCIEKSTGGFDLPPQASGYAYGYGPGPIEDSVLMELGSGKIYNQVSRQFSATIYLMWHAYTDHIYVPIGFVSWDLDWNITFGPKSDGSTGWTISRYDVIASPIQSSIGYPVWSGKSTPSDACQPW